MKLRDVWRVVDAARAAAHQVSSRSAENNEELLQALRNLETDFTKIDKILSRLDDKES